MTTPTTIRSAVATGATHGTIFGLMILVAMLAANWLTAPAPKPDPLTPVVVPAAAPESWIIKDATGRRIVDASLEKIAGSLKAGRWTAEGIPKPGEIGVSLSIVVDDGVVPVPPEPPKPPDPPTPPVPPTPVPIPSTEFRVAIIEEKDARGTIPPEQLAALFSTQIREYLNRKCAKGPDGKTPEWRFWDKDVVLSAESETWQKIWTATKPQLTKLPALVVIKGTDGKVLDYPANEAAALALLKQYGGE